MVYRKIIVAVLLLSAFGASVTQGQSLAVESDKLEALQNSLSNLEADIERLENDLEYYDEASVEAVQELEAAKLEADAKHNRLSKQQILTKNDPSEANERELRLIEHSTSMAERGVESKERRLDRLTRKRTEIFDELKDKYQLQASTTSKVQQQLTRLNALKARRAEALREQEIEKRAQEIAAKKVREQEAERARRAAEQRAAKARAQKEAEAAPVNKPDIPQKAVTLAAQGKAGEQTMVDGTDRKPSAADLEAVADLDLQRRMDRLKRRIDRGGDPILKSLDVRGEGIKTTDFKFVGGEQYIAYVVLPAGRLSLEINGKRHTEVVDEANDGLEHVLLYNHKNARRPRLFSFKRSLLKLLDSPPIE